MGRKFHKSFDEKGSAIAYLFLMIFLIGLISIALMRDSEVMTATVKMKDMRAKVIGDIEMIESAIAECVLSYPDPVDINSDGVIDAADNANPPYPVSGGTLQAIDTITCPGSGALIIDPQKGKFFTAFGDSRYTVQYSNVTAGDVFITIDYSREVLVWDEVLSQIDALKPNCTAVIDTATGSCATGSCLSYYIKRASSC